MKLNESYFDLLKQIVPMVSNEEVTYMQTIKFQKFKFYCNLYSTNTIKFSSYKLYP